MPQDTPFRQKKLHSCSRIIGRNDLAMIKARNKSHTGAAHVAEGSQCLVLLACHSQISDGIVMAVATPFQNSMLGTSTHTGKGHPSGALVTKN